MTCQAGGNRDSPMCRPCLPCYKQEPPNLHPARHFSNKTTRIWLNNPADPHSDQDLQPAGRPLRCVSAAAAFDVTAQKYDRPLGSSGAAGGAVMLSCVGAKASANPSSVHVWPSNITQRDLAAQQLPRRLQGARPHLGAESEHDDPPGS